MNHQWVSHLRRIAAEAMASTTTIRLGEVSSFDPNTYLAKVVIQPDGYETGWMPVLTQWLGNGWGLLSPPTKGDQVVVAFDGGSAESGIVLGGLFSDIQRPLQTPQGELWAVHQSGSSVKLLNSGLVEITGTTKIVGDAEVTGGLTVGGGASGSFSTPTGDTVTVQDGIVTNIY